MDTFLKNLVGTECWIFIDDVVVFSRSAEEHARRLESILQRFDEANLQLHPGKCAFSQYQVQYLDFVLSERGILASPDKVKAVKQYPTPKSVRDVRAFLGQCSFYRKVVPRFTENAKPLSKLTRNIQEFIWSPTQQDAFESMKNKLCTTPVLVYPDFKSPFKLTTDVSKIAIAVILSQVQDEIERPVAYSS